MESSYFVARPNQRADSVCDLSFPKLGPLTPKKCHLLETLPADLRNSIYDFVFDQPEDIHINFDEGHRSCTTPSINALAQTCKTIFHECRNLPLWLNNVHLHIPVLTNHSLIHVARHAAVPTLTNIQELPLSSPTPSSKHSQIEDQAGRGFSTLTSAVTRALNGNQMNLIGPFHQVLNMPDFVSRLRRVHVHLGSQVRDACPSRFFTAWRTVVQYLQTLCLHAELHLSFSLRISRNLIVDYDFGVQKGLASTLSRMDRCVLLAQVAELTLPEMSTINMIRAKVCETFFLVEEGGRLPMLFQSTT